MMRLWTIMVTFVMSMPAAAQMEPSDVWLWPAPFPQEVYRAPPVEHHRHHSMEAWKKSIAQQVRAYCKANPRDRSCPR